MPISVRCDNCPKQGCWQAYILYRLANIITNHDIQIKDEHAEEQMDLKQIADKYGITINIDCKNC